MKHLNNSILALLIIFGLLAGHACTKQNSLPIECFENQHDFSYMWWKKTIKTGNQVFAIKTNQYAL